MKKIKQLVEKFFVKDVNSEKKYEVEVYQTFIETIEIGGHVDLTPTIKSYKTNYGPVNLNNDGTFTLFNVDIGDPIIAKKI